MKDPNTAIYADTYGSTQTPATDGNWTKGEKQETKCRDPIFAVIFYANLAAIIGVAIALGPAAIDKALEIADEITKVPIVTNSTTNSTVNVTMSTTSALDELDDAALYFGVVIATGVISIGLSFLMLLAMMRFPGIFIKAAIYFVLATSLAWMIASFVTGTYVGGIVAAVVFLLGVCYAYFVWSRIPYASTNLATATTAVRDNCGVTGMSFLVVVMGFGWSILWVFANLGYWATTTECLVQVDDNTETAKLVCNPRGAGWVYFLLILSYFFGHQVLQNTIHVIISGVVGTWWFSPDIAHACCSAAIYDSTIRALTTSFGSICFGSLIVAFIETLRELAESAKNQGGDAQVLACIASCILGCLQSIVEYFNKWAYVYVGIYGYGYLEAGKNVMTLFHNRGWEVIIADNMINRALFLVSLVVGLLSGGFGVLIVLATKAFTDTGIWPLIISFLVGFVIGHALCSIFMSTVASAVNATIVLFAEAPAEFQQNYPELSDKMRAAWAEAWPGHTFY